MGSVHSRLDIGAADSVPVHVLRFFDALTRDRSSVDRIVQATSRWLGRAAAARCDGVVAATDPQGRTDGVWPDALVSTTATQDGVEVGLGGPKSEEDRALLGRFALCVAMALDEARRHGAMMPDHRAVDVLTDDAEGRASRRGAVERLGLTEDSMVRVLVASGTGPQMAVLVEALEHGGVRVVSTPRRQLTVILTSGPRVTALLQEGVPRGVRLGVSRTVRALEAPTALAEASAAFRFSQPSPRDRGPYLVEEGIAFEYRRLRGYDVLAEAMTPHLINRIHDVRALDRVLEDHGQEMLRTLDVAVAATSVRQAARLLDTHHNTVAHRLSIAEEVFGFSLADSYGRCRLYLAIVLRRIRESGRFTC